MPVPKKNIDTCQLNESVLVLIGTNQ